MTLYLVDKYDYELKKQNVETGLSIYGKKTEVCLKVLLAILIVSMCSFFVCSFAGQRITNVSQLWYLISIVGMVVPLITMCWIINRASKKLANHIEKNLQSRFKALVNVLMTMYYPTKIVKDEKINNEYAAKIDVLKVEKLVDIYESELKRIDDDESRRSKVLVGFLSVIGTCIATTVAEMRNWGISFNDWFFIVEVLIVIAFFISVPIYFVNEINPTKDKYKSMLAILKQYLVYIVEEDKKDSFENESVAKKNVPQKTSVQKKK